jgi:hypothetical protein
MKFNRREECFKTRSTISFKNDGLVKKIIILFSSLVILDNNYHEILDSTTKQQRIYPGSLKIWVCNEMEILSLNNVP